MSPNVTYHQVFDVEDKERLSSVPHKHKAIANKQCMSTLFFSNKLLDKSGKYLYCCQNNNILLYFNSQQ